MEAIKGQWVKKSVRLRIRPRDVKYFKFNYQTKYSNYVNFFSIEHTHTIQRLSEISPTIL